MAYTNNRSGRCVSIVGRDRLTWRSVKGRLLLFHRGDPNPLAVIEADSKNAGLYRIRYPDGDLSDLVNLSRAKDAASTFALRHLNSLAQETLLDRSYVRKQSAVVADVQRNTKRSQQPRNGFLARGCP